MKLTKTYTNDKERKEAVNLIESAEGQILHDNHVLVDDTDEKGITRKVFDYGVLEYEDSPSIPAPIIDPLVQQYRDAKTVDEKVVVIAKRLGLE